MLKVLPIASLALAALIAPINLADAQTAKKAPASKLAAPAAGWTIDARQSRIAFATKWAGNGVNGTFRQWSGDIKFDPNNLAGSQAVITIMTGSALTGVKEPDDNLATPDWFDARKFPTARYVTQSIRSVGPGRYVADGVLTVKGMNYRVPLPFTVAISGNVATMTGQVKLDRLALKLGLESDAGAEWVARETVVNVAVRATRK
ncbi:MAG: YceI family protein [Hyphomonadaceae bacterium]|jgi:polyisoprenoid-binding protein YceI|uniref:YceI family protein n=1 Tax=Aquidulcibacter sp. TaxID=2052990 RepID=UPI0022C02019|nr:YceI family protein [Aquidulcibacter sp.]MCE2890543.1 YceI family protein [Hyphomonadaceae bacterium]MCZ8207978.1 YceI family protein [Aquidulcibacter sp.]